MSEYKVEGYNVKQEGYDAPYLEGADFDPKVVFAYAGDPKAQAEYQDELKELSGAVIEVEDEDDLEGVTDEDEDFEEE